MAITSNDCKVAVVSDADDKFACLTRAIEAAGLRQELDEKRSAAGVAAAAFRIVIKPDLTFFFRPATTMTDPALVEYLIDWLFDAGYSNISLGTSSDGSASWLDNRDPLVLADLAGYHFETKNGAYDFNDFSEDTEPAAFPAGSVLHGTSLARPWLEADFRISFAKCRTDETFFYAGALQNLLDVLPSPDKEHTYNRRVTAADAVSELVRLTPVHFAIVDAYPGNQGNAGARHCDRLQVSTIVASASPHLADWAMALKLGVDPYRSPIVAKVLRHDDKADHPEVIGDLTPFPGVKNVHPMVADAIAKRNTSPAMQRAAAAWLQTVDRELFPFKDALTDRVNLLLAHQFGSLDSNPAVFAAFLTINYWLAGANQAVDAMNVMFVKDRVHWMERPLNLNLRIYSPADYEKSKAYMEPLEQIALDAPPDTDGLRWRYLDNSVLFYCSRRVPIPFADFVERVDISRAVRMMNDYIGGACVPVVRDAQGRVTHQAERNLYLPQPNYVALSGGQPIDVSKLEFITYAENEHKIFWRTVKSENDTARFDDGAVAFVRAGDDETLVTIAARQEFILPPFWQMMNLDLIPAVKDYLVSDAYRNFFIRTLANFEAAFEGREYRAGRPWPDPANDAVAEPALPTERLSAAAQRLAGDARAAMDRLTSGLSLSPPRPAPVEVDEHGFSHFAPAEESQAPKPKPLMDTGFIRDAAAAAATFTKDLLQAVSRDLAKTNKKD